MFALTVPRSSAGDPRLMNTALTVQEDLQLDLDDLQDLVVQHEGDVEKACSHLFDDNGVSSLSDPSSPEDSQSHAWKHGDDDAFGSLHSDGTEVDVDSGALFPQSCHCFRRSSGEERKGDPLFGSCFPRCSSISQVLLLAGERWDGAINESNSLPASQQISQVRKDSIDHIFAIYSP